jgi:hypothetical protein
MLELALLGKMIQWGNESNANKVLIRDGDCSVNPASQGHCTRVFIGRCLSAQRLDVRTHVPSSTWTIPGIFP